MAIAAGAIATPMSRSPRASSPAGCATAGIGKGDKVLFWSENRPEWVAALWGCLLEGVIAVPIDYRSSIDLVRRIHGIVNARALLVGDEVACARRSEYLAARGDRVDWRSRSR